MKKIYSTKEVSEKTGLTDRSVRRRITAGTDFPTLVIQEGNRKTLGVTETSLKAYLAKNK